MERKIMVAIASAALLAGCASTPKPKFIGGPLSPIVKNLGYPEREREFDGDTVYSWSYGYVKSRWIISNVKETCTVDVGTRDGLVKNIAYNGDSGPCSSLEDMLLYGR